MAPAVSPASSAAGPIRVGTSFVSASRSASSTRKATTVMLSRPPASLASRTRLETASSRLSLFATVAAIRSSRTIVVRPSEHSR